MRIREKMIVGVGPFLEADEQVVQVLQAETGPSRWWALLTLIPLFWIKYHVIAVTDRSVLVLRASTWRPSRPKTLVARHARTGSLAVELEGLWGKIDVGGVRMRVHRRYFGDVRAADALPAQAAPPPPPPPPPSA